MCYDASSHNRHYNQMKELTVIPVVVPSSGGGGGGAPPPPTSLTNAGTMVHSPRASANPNATASYIIVPDVTPPPPLISPHDTLHGSSGNIASTPPTATSSDALQIAYVDGNAMRRYEEAMLARRRAKWNAANIAVNEQNPLTNNTDLNISMGSVDGSGAAPTITAAHAAVPLGILPPSSTRMKDDVINIDIGVDTHDNYDESHSPKNNGAAAGDDDNDDGQDNDSRQIPSPMVSHSPAATGAQPSFIASRSSLPSASTSVPPSAPMNIHAAAAAATGVAASGAAGSHTIGIASTAPTTIDINGPTATFSSSVGMNGNEPPSPSSSNSNGDSNGTSLRIHEPVTHHLPGPV
jgi:hypothetical protein